RLSTCGVDYVDTRRATPCGSTHNSRHDSPRDLRHDSPRDLQREPLGDLPPRFTIHARALRMRRRDKSAGTAPVPLGAPAFGSASSRARPAPRLRHPAYESTFELPP